MYAVFSGCKGDQPGSLMRVTADDCVCPGDIVTYECTVFGGSGVTSVWKGNFFRCCNGKQAIEYIHSQLTSEESNVRICNNGDIVGGIVRVENERLTSQISIALTYNISGKGIECISDSGTNIRRVGFENLTTG